MRSGLKLMRTRANTGSSREIRLHCGKVHLIRNLSSKAAFQVLIL